jgi:hypothetical protein
MWPLPGLYFIEIVALSSISAFVFVRGDPRDNFITWGAAGAISAFSILGALSVGLFYLPVALIFAIISVTSDVRNKQHITAHLGIFLIAGIAQFALMFAAIRVLDSNSIFYAMRHINQSKLLLGDLGEDSFFRRMVHWLEG